MAEDKIIGGEELSEVAGGVGSIYFEYVVQWGDTLSEIAKRFHTTVKTLAQINNIVDPDFIRAGEVLRIPKPS